MKIIFLYPEYYEIARFGKKRKEYPPFGVMYLAAVAEKNGENVSIQSVTNENYIFDLSTYDVVAYSLSSSCTYNIMRKSRQMSIFSKNVKILVGGIHASLYSKDVFMAFNADYLTRGEGEIALIKILENIRNNMNIEIKGVMTKNNYNEDISYADYVYELDTVPYPARHLLPEEDIIMTGRLSIRSLRMTHILVSRGCPFNCYFCGGINKNHRYRSADSVYNELVYLKNHFNIQGFVINDENFTVNKKKVIEICEKIKQLEMPWSALSRVDTVDEEMISHLAKAHCIELKFGLESGSDTMLRIMNKKCDVSQAEDTLSLCGRKT